MRVLILDLFNIAIENDYALKNPAKGVRLSNKKPNGRIVLSVEQQKELEKLNAVFTDEEADAIF